MICDICYDEISNHITCDNKPITCTCDKTFCLSCVKQWVKESRSVTCLSCKTSWSNRFIRTNLPADFVNEIEEIEESKVIEQQSLLLNNYAEDYIRFKEFIRLGSMIHDIRRRNWSLDHDRLRNQILNNDDYDDDIFRNQSIDNDDQIELNRLEREQRAINFYQQVEALNTNENRDRNIVQSLRLPCPINSCKGCIIDDECLVCQAKVCNDCYVIISENHKCSEDDINTYKLLKESKHCPSCNNIIHRTQGCDVMFCTACKTGFGWSTLEIIKDVTRIHNPHFTEEVFARARDLYPNVDVNNIRYEELVHNLFRNDDKIRINGEEFTFKYKNIYNDLEDIIQHDLEGYYKNYAMQIHIYRFEYLSGRIPESEWKRSLYNNYCMIKVCRSILDLLTSQELNIRILLDRILEAKSQEDIDIIDLEFGNMIAKINDEIKELYYGYDTTIYEIKMNSYGRLRFGYIPN